MDEKEKEELLKKIEEYTKKIEEYSKKIEKNPNDTSNYYNRGIAYRNRGNTFKSLERLQEAVEDFKKAIESYDKAIELNPNNAYYYNNKGNAYYSLEDYDKAIESYDKAIELNPNNASYYNNKGIAFKNLGDYDKAINNYSQAINLDPKEAIYYNNRGLALNILGDNKEAIESYAKAIELNPNNASYYNNRGIAFKNLGDNQKAIEDYQKAIELNPNNASYFNNRGLVFNNLGDNQKAIEDYEKAIELNPNYSLAYNNRGISFYNLKEYEKAIEDYEKAIELNPNNASYYNNRGIAFKNLGDNKKAIKLDPNNNAIINLKKNKSTQQDNKVIDTIENNQSSEKTNKEDNIEPYSVSDFNEIKSLYLNGNFKEAKEKLKLFKIKYKNISKTDIKNSIKEIENSIEDIEPIETSINNSPQKEEGYLIFADILGWKKIWKNKDSDEKIKIVNKLIAIKDNLKDKKNFQYNVNLISDTFIISSNDFEIIKEISKKLIEECLKNNFVIRGAISYGEYYNRDTVYLGPAVHEAASWHDEGEEIGIFCTPSAKQEIINNKYNLQEDFIKLKSGEIKTFFINWYNNETKEKFYELFKTIDKTSIKVYLKYLNTEKKFISYANKLSIIEEKNEMLRIGNGYDVHKLVEGRKLMLGGVEVPHTKGVLGHSDGDVLLHAITDAIIGALGLGDIGLHFPDNDENLKDIDSAILLKKINNIMKEKNYKIVNLDSIIVIQKPKLRPYIDSIRDNIAKILEIDSELINVKAKTEEKLGFTGDETGVKSYCVVLLEKEKC